MKNFQLDETILTRLFDIFGALIAMLLFSPVFLAVGILILLLDGRPILFRQFRVGRGGKPFVIFKFRTMHSGKGGMITAAGDHRVTALGRHLRSLKLDELPQMINVLKGDMSLIGPRPEVPQYVDLRDSLWRSVLETKPGVTDLSSLVYRDEEKLLAPAGDIDAYYREKLLPAKLRLSLRYQRTRSLLGDFKLLWLTLQCSLLPRVSDRDRITRTFGVYQP